MSSKNIIQKCNGQSIQTKKKKTSIFECPEIGLNQRLGRRVKEDIGSPSLLLPPIHHLPPTPPRPYACSQKECDWTQINVLINKSLALILPDGLKHAMEIEHTIKEKGFTIIQKNQVRLSSEQASELMENFYGHLIYLPMVCYLTSAPLIALCLAKKNAVEELKKLCGPENIRIAMRDFPYSIRAIFGDPKAEDPIKVIHCSQTLIDAEREIHLFFPELILEPYLRTFEVNDYLHERLLSTLRNGLAQLLQEKPIDPIVWLGDWLLCNNPYKPRVKREIALTET